MSLLANHPTFSYVSATGITLIYKEEMHVVHDFNTNKMFIWWDESVPNIFQASNVRPDAKTGRYLVIVNENGTPMVVPHSEIQLFFDGNSLANVTDRIYGLYEKNEENGERFLAIEQDIDGIQVTVGDLQEEDNLIKQDISKIEQRADEIDLSVKSVTKSFNDDKEIRELRESLNGAIIKLNADIGLFKSNWNDYIKDDAITSLESTEIKAHLSAIQLSLTALYVPVNTVLDYARNNGMNSDVTKLNSAISALDIAHRNLVDGTNAVIADGIITPSDRTVMINAFSRYNLRIDELKNVCDDVILLGMGGNVIEQFAYINIQADKIENKVAVVENGVETNASTITQTAEDIRSEVTLVEKGLDDKIKIAESSITQTAKDIRSEVTLVEKGLDDKIKIAESSITQTAKDIRAEVKAVEIDLDGKISTNESSITQTATAIRAEVKSITDGLQSSITQNADNIALKVNANGVINAISLDTSGALIQASKINLTGYATFNSLKDEGQTTINGSNITTGTLNASLVNVTNLNATNITTGTLSADRVSGGTMIGVIFKTANREAQVGVEINGNSAYFGNTHIGYGGGHFKIEADRNTSYSSVADIYLMPGMSGGTATGNGSVRVSGHTRTSGRFYSNNIECMTSSVANGYYGLMAGTSNTNWVRTTSNGLLPYASGDGTGNSSLGSTGWRFNELHCRAIFENGTQLANKYSAASHTHSNYSTTTHTHSNYFSTSGGTISGNLTTTGTITSDGNMWVKGNLTVSGASGITASGGFTMSDSAYLKRMTFNSPYGGGSQFTHAVRLNTAILVGFSSGNVHLISAGNEKTTLFAVIGGSYSLPSNELLSRVNEEISPLQKLDETIVVNNQIIPITNYKTNENINKDCVFINDENNVEINLNNTVGSLWDICKSLRYENNVLKEENKKLNERLENIENIIKELPTTKYTIIHEE